MNGVIQATLAASRTYNGTTSDSVVTERVLVAYLRMNVPAARALRTAIDRALLLATPPGSQEKN